MTPLRFGIVGAGRWARTVHVPWLRAIADVQLVAVASRTPENRQALIAAHGEPLREYATAEALYADPEVDAVIVATPNDSHAALAAAGLRAGKHVFCEKPLGFTLADCDAVARAQAESGATLAVDYELRCSDVAQRMSDSIRLGRIGAPRMIGCLLLRDWGRIGGWRGDPARSGGLFLELGSHYFDLMALLAAQPATRVYVSGGDLGGTDQPDHFWATVTFGQDVHACFGLSLFAAARNEIHLHAIGDEGRLEGELLSGSVWWWPRRQPEPEEISPRQTRYEQPGWPGSREVLEDFVRAIRTGTEPACHLANARAVTAIAVAADRSWRSGRPVALAELEAEAARR